MSCQDEACKGKGRRVLRRKNLATTERYIKHLNLDIRETLELLST
jgi:hypothetical protein